LIWDDEARVWIAESEDIPGLILEAKPVDALIEEVKLAAPDIKLDFKTERPVVVA
jgi:hypothetical protein